jgi:hypothetical protein
MEMPKPGEAHKKLSRLIGEWTGPETMHPAPWDPVGGPATARVVNRPILAGFAVVQEYQQHRNGVPNLSGHGVFWFDQARHQYVLNWWDSMGGKGGEYRGGFNGEVLELQSAMPQGGHSKVSFDLGNPGAYVFALAISGDGQNWQPAIDGRYKKAATRKKSAAKAAKRAARAAKPARSAKARRSRTAARKRPRVARGKKR